MKYILQEAYQNKKKNLYFKIPVLPKKPENILLKKELLILEDINSNIMHEMVRRNRWNYAQRGISTKTGALMFFDKDCSGCSPYMSLIEKAPFDIIVDFSFLLQDLREEEKQEIQPKEEVENDMKQDNIIVEDG